MNNSKYIVDLLLETENSRFDLMIKDKTFNMGLLIDSKITDSDVKEGTIKGLE